MPERKGSSYLGLGIGNPKTHMVELYDKERIVIDKNPGKDLDY